MALICTKTWNSQHQRFRFVGNGQQYVITRTKGGKNAVHILAGYRAMKGGGQAEVWRKLSDVDDQREALNEIARTYGDQPCFRIIMGL